MIKFWTLVGVSSDRQAQEDKASIPDQIKTCRKTIDQLGGVEVGCSIMDGFSRTGYDSLADAMTDIPPLKEAIEAAARNEYDVLILDNWDRMGDIAQLMHTRFKKYRKQIFSARQSSRLHDPATYNPYSDDASSIDMHVQGILQSYRINKIRRGWELGVPARIDRGLPPFRVAYGYKRIDKNTPPEKVDSARFVLMMKDWILEGRALQWIAEELDRIGAPKPSRKGKRWHVESVRHILLNPFYCGIVAIGQKKVETRSKHGRLYRGRTPESSWKKNKGLHVPLWDEQTYLAIQNEFERRMKLKNYAKTVYPLSGLLRCTVCKQKLIRVHISRGGKLYTGLSCKYGNTHIQILYEEAARKLGDVLKQSLQEARANPPKPEEELARLQAQLNEYQDERKTVQEGFKHKIFNAAEAAAQISELERKEKTIQTAIEAIQHNEQSRSQAFQIAHDLSNMDDLGEWILTDEAPIVNQLLSALCESVWVTPENEISVEFRK